MTNFLPGDKVEQIVSLLEQGKGVREVAKTVGVGSYTVTKYRQEWLSQRKASGLGLPLCECGEPIGHRGWCAVRYARSVARQKFVRDWDGQGVMKPPDGISCRACGAVWACPPEKEDHFQGVCATCNNRFSVGFKEDRDPTIDDFNAFLMRRIQLDLKRIRRTGFAGRCEAISAGNYTSGYQCAMSATMEKEGRRVCASHGDPSCKTSYVDSAHVIDPWLILQQLLIDLGKADSGFRGAVLTAAKSLEQKP